LALCPSYGTVMPMKRLQPVSGTRELSAPAIPPVQDASSKTCCNAIWRAFPSGAVRFPAFQLSQEAWPAASSASRAPPAFMPDGLCRYPNSTAVPRSSSSRLLRCGPGMSSTESRRPQYRERVLHVATSARQGGAPAIATTSRDSRDEIYGPFGKARARSLHESALLGRRRSLEGTPTCGWGESPRSGRVTLDPHLCAGRSEFYREIT